MAENDRKPPSGGRIRRPGGWILPVLLIGAYALLKLQGWFYAQKVQELQRELDGLRPILSGKVYAGHLQESRLAHGEAIHRIRRMNLDGARLLSELSRHLPASVTVDRVELHPASGIRILGNVLPGTRPVESVVVPWAEKLQVSLGTALRVRELYPSAQTSGRWEFHLQMDAADHA